MSKQEAVHSSRLRYSHPSLELPPCFHRLHEPRSSCIHTNGCPCPSCGDITIPFDVIVLDWRNLIVEFLHLLWDYIYCCYMIVLYFLPLRLSCKESSTFSPSPSSSGSGDVTALRCSEPLRSKVGGPSKVYAIYSAGWDRLTIKPLLITCYYVLTTCFTLSCNHVFKKESF